jgi:AmpE protein
VQANNRLFAVIFWFVLLGPFGAWTYRVTDLIRRRAAFNVTRDGENETRERFLRAARLCHGWLAWLPARLTALGFALAGSFDGALRVWRTPAADRDHRSSELSEMLLARVGSGALALERREGESDVLRAVRGAHAVKGMILRLLIIWAAVIGAMTLYGWSL